MAIDLLEKACQEDFVELKQELKDSLESAKNQLHHSDQAYKLLSADQGKSLSVYGFDDKFFSSLEVNHSHAVKNFIENWLTKQSDWRFAWCWICRTHVKYTPLSVKSHLVYICTKNYNTADIANVAKTDYNTHPSSFLQKVRMKPLNDYGLIYDIDIPYNQIGTIICLDYFPYLSLEQIKQYLESFKKILRPGGQAMVHYADGDNEKEWQEVVNQKITFCNEETIRKYSRDLKLDCKFYHIDSMYSFFVITKLGEKTSIKQHMTKIEPVTKKIV